MKGASGIGFLDIVESKDDISGADTRLKNDASNRPPCTRNSSQQDFWNT